MFELPADRVAIMGILNLTPDSFSDGGRFDSIEASVNHAFQMIEDGADIVDVGGESTRPGAIQVNEQEELDRVMPVLEKLSGIPCSIDTYKANVAELALQSGCAVINDVSALGDPLMAEVAARWSCPVCLMHRGKVSSEGAEAVQEVVLYLKKKIQFAMNHGVQPSHIWIDPGFGFGKSLQNDVDLLQNLDELRNLGFPVLAGISRKRLSGALVSGCLNYEAASIRPVQDRLIGSVIANLFAAEKGARIIRVHDVKETMDAFRVWDCLKMKPQR